MHTPEPAVRAIGSDRRGSEGPAPTWMFVLPWELSAPGGVSQVVENLFDTIPDVLGWRSLLLVNTWGARHPRVDVVDGRRTVRMAIQSPVGPDRMLRRAVSFMVRLPAALLRLRSFLARESIAGIHVHYPGLDAVTWLLVRAMASQRPRLVLSFHGTDFSQAQTTHGVARWLWSLLLRQADDVTACSSGLRDDMIAAFGAAATAIRVVPNGVDPPRIEAASQSAPVTAVPPCYLLSLATFERKKGLDVLIDAFVRVSRQHPDVDLVLAGRVGEADHFAQLQAQRQAAPCSGRIHFLPVLPHEDAMRVLRRAAMLVLASRREPFGIVVLEAGVLGVPVVATQVCGVVPLLARAGLVAVPAGDPAALAEAIGQLLADASLRRSNAMSLREQVLWRFTWRHVASDYVKWRRPGHFSSDQGAPAS